MWKWMDRVLSEWTDVLMFVLVIVMVFVCMTLGKVIRDQERVEMGLREEIVQVEHDNVILSEHMRTLRLMLEEKEGE